jgi:hypothetical protein
MLLLYPSPLASNSALFVVWLEMGGGRGDQKMGLGNSEIAYSIVNSYSSKTQ